MDDKCVFFAPNYYEEPYNAKNFKMVLWKSLIIMGPLKISQTHQTLPHI
jgi:hypothetical protein